MFSRACVIGFTCFLGITSVFAMNIIKMEYVVKAFPETTVNGSWLSDQIDECIDTLVDCGFNVLLSRIITLQMSMLSVTYIKNMVQALMHPAIII